MAEIKKQQKSLGDLLINAGIITNENLNAALFEQKRTGAPIGKILVRMGFVSESEVLNALQGMLAVVFEVSGELFAVEVIYTREILNYKRITPVPSMPAYVLGMITLRDSVVPVLSLGARFFNRREMFTEDTKILVVESNGEPVGLIADNVRSVRNFNSADIDRQAGAKNSAAQKYSAGIIKDNNELITLLNTDEITSPDGPRDQ
ncbi:MAG TPA: hypothetical protein ENN55_04760 [Firmicutes bacterium]|nr:hypothetical protein [Bacillota bacterium]